jgi:glycosyltransferase involved in cell wall biosynthesis
VHDWLTLTGGAERVLAQMLEEYPHADLFCVVCFRSAQVDALLKGRPVHTTFIQKLPWARKRYRSYLPLMPLAIEQFDLSGYDVVISSSHAVAKGVITGPDQVHIAYVYSPIRYAWDLQATYLREAGLLKGPKSWLARMTLHYMRLWDLRTAPGVDHFIGISHFIRRRIAKVYRRDAQVIYPSVDVDRFDVGTAREDFYITASRMVPYKHIPLIAAAFARMPDKRLLIIGDGPERALVEAAAGANVTLLGFLDDAEVADHFRRAKAFVFAAEEDFGIVPLEAQACGTPVIAYGAGGSLETIRGEDAAQPTGLFFAEQSVDSIVDAIRRFEAMPVPIDPHACRANAERFSNRRFREELRACVDRAVDAHRSDCERITA